MAIGFIILEKSEAIAHLISRKLKKIWVFAELLLFVLVGAQVNIHVAWGAGLAGLVVVFVGLVFRSAGTYLSLLGTDLNHREKMFCVVAYVPKATVQAAIGAIPLSAGLASGEVILAIAVLSILVTAPLGAIGIVYWGERILDHGQHSVYRFKALRTGLELPTVGERVLHRRSNKIWKVIEEREIWLDNPVSDPRQGAPDPPSQPAIYQRYWPDNGDGQAGKGKTMERTYRPGDVPFPNEWEILYDW
jgi:Kef-type K+ transport system membrane component KefB